MPITTAAQRIIRHPDETLPTGSLPTAFWEVVGRYRGDLVNQAYAILGDREDAEDAVQETFCEAYRRREKLKAADSVSAAYKATIAIITPATARTVCQSVRRTNSFSALDNVGAAGTSCGNSSCDSEDSSGT